MKAIIADDEKHLAEDLRRRLLRLWPELEIIDVLSDGISTAAALKNIQPDIAFLDISMPGMTGMEAAQSAHMNCRIVFVTAYDKYAIQAFEQAAVDYLLKPVSDKRLLRCVERLQQNEVGVSTMQPSQLHQPLGWIRAQVGKTVHMVSVDDVCYLQASDKYTSVFTKDSELLLRASIKELLTQLDPKVFWQVHRGTVVNIRQVVSARREFLGKLSLNLRDRPERLSVSITYANLFRKM